MKLEIEKLGPINKASLELGDINIILGPPNTGKSYTLRSLYYSLIVLDEDIIKRRINKLITKNIDNFVKKLNVKTNEVFKKLFLLFDESYDPEFSIYTLDKSRKNLLKNLENIEKKIEQLNETNKDKNISYNLIKSRNQPKEYLETAILQIKIEEIDEIQINEMFENFKKLIEDSKYEFLPIDDEQTKIIIHTFLPDFKKLIVNLLKITNKSFVFNLDSSKDYYFRRYLISKKNEISKKGFIKIRQELGKDKLRLKGNIVYNINLSELVSDFRRISNEFLFYEDFYFDLYRKIRIDLIETINQNFSESFDLYVLNSPIKAITFIPFGRTPLIYSINNRRFIRENEENLILNSYFIKIKKAIQLLLSKKDSPEKLIKLFSPLIQGEITYDKMTKKLRYKKFNSPDLPLEFASALASEITGILLPILTLPPESFIIIEEPESQLHYSAQILMALVLFALSKKYGHKIIFSTHSDIFAITLAYLEKLHYKKEDIINLIREILKIQGINIEKINDSEIEVVADYLTASEKILSVKYFYYNPKQDQGVVIETKNSEMIMEDVPGITNVTEILASWALNLTNDN